MLSYGTGSVEINSREGRMYPADTSRMCALGPRQLTLNIDLFLSNRIVESILYEESREWWQLLLSIYTEAGVRPRCALQMLCHQAAAESRRSVFNAHSHNLAQTLISTLSSFIFPLGQH